MACVDVDVDVLVVEEEEEEDGARGAGLGRALMFLSLFLEVLVMTGADCCCTGGFMIVVPVVVEEAAAGLVLVVVMGTALETATCKLGGCTTRTVEVVEPSVPVAKSGCSGTTFLLEMAPLLFAIMYCSGLS